MTNRIEVFHPLKWEASVARCLPNPIKTKLLEHSPHMKRNYRLRLLQ